ncbi:MAG TPA: hypothetical protein VFP20_06145 [Bacteroidales bacterium]|nr:hypothetical protein [Bacteroidales bacterium]
MKINEIETKIDEIHSKFAKEKDGGEAFISELSKEFKQYSFIDKQTIDDFLISKITENTSTYKSMVLPLIVEMEAFELAPRIFEAYSCNSKDENADWEFKVISTLFILKYKEPQEYYFNIIKKYITSKNDQRTAFILSVLYCYVNSERAIDFLSDYFCKHLVSHNSEMLDFLQSRIGFLIYHFSTSPNNYLTRLIQKTGSINKLSGKLLEEIVQKSSIQNSDYENNYIENNLIYLVDPE